MIDNYILVTGGCGYIGSHITLALRNMNYPVVVVDNLSTGHQQNRQPGVIYQMGDIGNSTFLNQLFNQYPISTVIHLAAKTSVEESAAEPAYYYEENTIKTIELIKAAAKYQIKHFIFSSTAAVYAESNKGPVKEDYPTNPINVYGKTKYLAELALTSLASQFGMQLVICRYFNVVGHHDSLQIGNFNSHASALIQKIFRNLVQQNQNIVINGDDFDTPDGTSIRDYVHVMDIAKAHLLFLDKIRQGWQEQLVVNIGYGRGSSVLEIIHHINRLLNQNVLKYTVGPRRLHDIPYSVADNTRLHSLGWHSHFDDPFHAMLLSEMLWCKKQFSPNINNPKPLNHTDFLQAIPT